MCCYVHAVSPELLAPKQQQRFVLDMSTLTLLTSLHKDLLSPCRRQSTDSSSLQSLKKHFSLIAGAQCDRAAELFEQMQQQGCVPDVVTFTALISAYEKGGQWRRALAAYELMRQQRCKPDAIVYNAIIDALWETGVIWAQRKALTLYQVQHHLLIAQLPAIKVLSCFQIPCGNLASSWPSAKLSPCSRSEHDL